MRSKMDMSLGDIVSESKDSRKRNGQNLRFSSDRRKAFGPYRKPWAKKTSPSTKNLSGKRNPLLVTRKEPLPGRLGPATNNNTLTPNITNESSKTRSQNSPRHETGIVIELSNINTAATPQDIEAVLSVFGEILDLVILSEKSGNFKGTVRATFKNVQDGLKVVKRMNGQVADGRILSVKTVKGISIAGAASSMSIDDKNFKTKISNKNISFSRSSRANDECKDQGFRRGPINSGNTRREEETSVRDSNAIWKTIS